MLLSEKEITSKWIDKNIVVSICMLAFNHEDYIEAALEGILSQDVDFGYEILVHDDASNDGTVDILKKYVEKYPKIIKPIYQNKNCWSRGINPSVFFNYPRAQGQYVAWCEGDDAWISPSKLKMQIDVLRSNDGLDLCFHLAQLQNCVSGSTDHYSIGHFRSDSGIVSFDDAFLRRYGMIPTASCVVRRSVMENLMEFMQERPYLTSGDVYMQALGALRGGGFFINNEMSLYRFGTSSSLTKGILSDGKNNVNHHASCIRGAISLWKNYFPLRGENTLKKLIYKRLIWLFLSDGRGRGLVDEMGIRKLYDVYEKIENYMAELKFRLENRKIILYGCGHEAAKIIENIGAEKIEFIIDRDEKRIDGEFHGVPFKEFSEIKPSAELLLLITTMFYDEEKILSNARKLGVGKNNILRIEDEILNLINISDIWMGEVLVSRDEIMNMNKRVSG